MKRVTEDRIKKIKKLFVCNRIKVLIMLLKKDRCVCQMVAKTNLKHSLLSHHLKILLDMGFVTSLKNGQHNIYSLVESKRKIVMEIMDIIEAN